MSAAAGTSRRRRNGKQPVRRRAACQKSHFGLFRQAAFRIQNRILQYYFTQLCRCGGLLNAKGHPDGFLSHFSSLRNFRLSMFLTACSAARSSARRRFPAETALLKSCRMPYKSHNDFVNLTRTKMKTTESKLFQKLSKKLLTKSGRSGTITPTKKLESWEMKNGIHRKDPCAACTGRHCCH